MALITRSIVFNDASVNPPVIVGAIQIVSMDYAVQPGDASVYVDCSGGNRQVTFAPSVAVGQSTNIIKSGGANMLSVSDGVVVKDVINGAGLGFQYQAATASLLQRLGALG